MLPATPSPSSGSPVLYINNSGPELEELERDLLGSQQPMAVAISWFWRCFDPSVDFWPRASILAIAYEGKFAIVDFWELEDAGCEAELRGKDVVRRILEMPHLLKVVHDLDNSALDILQRAVIPAANLYDENPDWVCITPAVDLSLVTAFVRRTRPGCPTASKLSGLVFDYLRFELCQSELLSNWERRPLRQTQLHHALASAWCPLMILRCFCSFGIVEQRDVMLMTLRFGHRSMPQRWHWSLQQLSFLSSHDAGLGDGDVDGAQVINGAYAEDLWTDPSEEAEEWYKSLPRPDRSVDLFGAMKRAAEPLFLPVETQQAAQVGVATLFDRATAARRLDELYSAFRAFGAGASPPS